MKRQDSVYESAQKRLRQKAKELPDEPGVYFFLQKAQKTPGKAKILYIGKATSLRDRVRSYFSDDVIHTRGARIVDMVAKANDLDFVKADSVLEAVILEANLIKEHQPYYNVNEKDDKSFNYIVITREDFPQVLTVRGKDLDEHFPKNKIKHIFGPYPSGGMLRESMRIIRRIFPYRDAKCEPCQADAGQAGAECVPCFNRQIGLCPGVCTGEISKADYAKQVRNITLFFEGKKHTLMNKLEREMFAHAKKQEFEQANQVKRVIFALTHIQDVSLIKEDINESLPPATLQSGEKAAGAFRIEGFDIAHMSGKNMVGVMTVLEGREAKRADYRMFKIRFNTGADDTKALREVLDRRLNHPEWTFPHLIVIDGGVAQKNAAEALLRERGFDIAVVSVVKDDRHRPDHILPGPKDAPKDDPIRILAERYHKEILLVNSEAHRFAIKYHRKLRSKLFGR